MLLLSTTFWVVLGFSLLALELFADGNMFLLAPAGVSALVTYVLIAIGLVTTGPWALGVFAIGTLKAVVAAWYWRSKQSKDETDIYKF